MKVIIFCMKCQLKLIAVDSGLANNLDGNIVKQLMLRKIPGKGNF